MEEPLSATELHKAGQVTYWVIWPHPRGHSFVVVPGLEDDDPPGAALSEIPDWLNLHDAHNRHASLEAAATWCRRHSAPLGVHVTEAAWDASL